MPVFGKFLLNLLLLLMMNSSQAAISVKDDMGEEVRLTVPAKRIISLAPHATEMLFTVGAGNRIVGVVGYSDYPQAARKIRRIGNYQVVDIERIVSLKPDLVVAWHVGNNPAQVEKLKKLGIPVYVTEPRRLSDIPSVLQKLGRLTGNSGQARQAAARFMSRYWRLRKLYKNRKKVSVFYQVWHRPLMTVGGRHLISQVIGLCGGRNVFDDQVMLTPRIGVESVLQRNPQVIVASGMDASRPEWLDAWRKWKQLSAVRRGHLYFIHPDLLHRPTVRIMDGAEQMCVSLDKARGRR